jgi:hypothetical protein
MIIVIIEVLLIIYLTDKLTIIVCKKTKKWQSDTPVWKIMKPTDTDKDHNLILWLYSITIIFCIIPILLCDCVQ